MTKNVMTAMSGGVDSSIAAALLIEQGYNVCGATFRLFSNDGLIGITCSSPSDVEDARRVADKLNINHFVFDFGDSFRTEVIRRFADAYLQGRTPNPCIDCNRYIKFDRLLERALEHNMDFIATGHYAQVAFDEKTGRYLLKKAKDKTKDQTYVLYTLSQTQLKHAFFPLGGLTKSEVRSMAEARGLLNAKKPDSQDICFVPDGDYASFIENVLGIKSAPGYFTDSCGNILGMHQGLIRYTIGQRRGLNLSFDRPKYVIKKDASTNTVVIGDENELYSDRMTVEEINLIAAERIEEPLRAAVKTRYSQKEAPATLFPPENGRMTVHFDTPQRAVTSGQRAVFYDNDIVIGGGTIV